jgi:hypothetical protein
MCFSLNKLWLRFVNPIDSLENQFDKKSVARWQSCKVAKFVESTLQLYNLATFKLQVLI